MCCAGFTSLQDVQKGDWPQEGDKCDLFYLNEKLVNNSNHVPRSILLSDSIAWVNSTLSFLCLLQWSNIEHEYRVSYDTLETRIFSKYGIGCF